MEAEHIPIGITIPMTSVRAGTILADYLDGGDGGPELREAMRAYRDQYMVTEDALERLAEAWDDIVEMLAETSRQAAALSGIHYETHSADPWLDGHASGEALTWRQVNTMVVDMVNGAHLRKAGTGGSGG